MASLTKQFRFTQPGRGNNTTARWLCAPIMVILISFANTSCHSSPDDMVAESYPARVNVDWSGCGYGAPSGMTLLFHHSETGEMVRVTDNNTDRTTARLAEGRHWATVFNLSPDEFNNIGFRGLETVQTAEAFARQYSGPQWHSLPSDENSYVARQPEWLAADTILTAAAGPTSLSDAIGTLHPRNITRTLHITVDTGNPGALIAARGAISGLAAGRRLAADTPQSSTVIQLIDPESWSRSDQTSVKASVSCFGLPPDRQGHPEENILEFQALLADGKTVKTYTIPVGDLIRNATGNDNSLNNSPDLFLELKLDPPLPSTENSGNIDIWLQDWDETIDLNLPL